MSGWSIVVPMYRESSRIRGTVARLATSELARPDNEFLFVDDGSPDDTVGAVSEALASTELDARVLRLPRNLGKGAAVRTGVLAARHPVVAFVDADLSSPPRAVVEVCRAVEAGADVAVASRAHATSRLVVRQPATREGAGKTFNRLLRALGLTELPDTQCGLKAFDADAARALFVPLRTLRFAFDVELLLRARRLGLRIDVLPTEWAHVEASRVSPVRDGGRMAWDALRLAVRQRTGRDDRPTLDVATLTQGAQPDLEGRWELAAPRGVRRADLEQAAAAAGLEVLSVRRTGSSYALVARAAR
jgi:glycosyltransferase involved in cell wall biosynthesis